MPEQPFAPQLALFVASRSTLALYREFVFPMVPTGTGMLPTTLDDLRVSKPENISMAIDIALSRAAVVVYDAEGSRIPLEYIYDLRRMSATIVVRTPISTAAEGATDQLSRSAPGSDPQSDAPERPENISEWDTFAGNVLRQIMSRSKELAPTLDQVGEELERLRSNDDYAGLILTTLALIEHKLRMADAPTSVSTQMSPSASARLTEQFQIPDHVGIVQEAVQWRHRILRHPQGQGLEQAGETQPGLAGVPDVSAKLVDVARQFLGIPPHSP